MDQVWYEVLLSDESDVRVYAESGFITISAYSNAQSSDLVIKEDLICESTSSN